MSTIAFHNYITVLIMLKIIPKLIHALFYGVDLIRTLIDFPCLAYFDSFPYTFLLSKLVLILEYRCYVIIAGDSDLFGGGGIVLRILISY